MTAIDFAGSKLIIHYDAEDKKYLETNEARKENTIAIANHQVLLFLLSLSFKIKVTLIVVRYDSFTVTGSTFGMWPKSSIATAM